MEKIKETLTPTEYFERIKDKKNIITDEDLSKIYENCIMLAEKYLITGQTAGLKKIMFHLESLEKEREIVKLGIDTFIYRDDIEEYIDKISKNVVKIIELENYEREIPDEIIEVIKSTKDKFTKMYVLFTDYTGKIEKTVERIRRDKDPILFGTFQDEKSETMIERFYFLGDWVDEHCDLTLDRMVTEIKEKTNKDVIRTINTPLTLEELKNQLKTIEENKDGKFVITNKPVKKSFFSNIKSFLGKK